MSQHHLTMLHNGAPIHIQLGWDRALHEFFMHVEKLIAHDDDDEVSPYLYSTFEDHELRSGCLNLEYFLDKLRSLDITLPAQMIDDLELDKQKNVGNKHVVYHTELELGGHFVGLASPGSGDQLVIPVEAQLLPLRITSRDAKHELRVINSGEGWTTEAVREVLGRSDLIKDLEASSEFKDSGGAHAFLGSVWIARMTA